MKASLNGLNPSFLSESFPWPTRKGKYPVLRTYARQGKLKQGKKIKFKALAIRQPDQTNDMINKIDVVMDNPESETVTGKYYQVEELPSLMSDLDNSLSFFHLNISSLPFHY